MALKEKLVNTLDINIETKLQIIEDLVKIVDNYSA